MQTLYTLRDAEREIGEGAYPSLIRSLVDHGKIPLTKIGGSFVIDESGLAQLKVAFHAWKNRPRIRPRQPIAS